MQIHEMPIPEGTPVDGYGPGFFRVAGVRHEGAMLLLPTGRAPWGGYDDTAPILEAAGSVDVLLVGTGSEMAYLPDPFREALEEAGIGIETMASGQACRSYNVLLGEGRRVGLAVLPA